jgi:uncharacterized protein YbcC (UPF0753/DUF2309 family)
MKKRRRLGDLYVRGKEVSVDDGTNDPVRVWLQKLNEIERDAVLRRANAAKARYMLECEHDESELFVSTFASVREYLDREGLLDIVTADEVVAARQRIEAQLTNDEDGWGKDNKISDLLDAWTGSDEVPGLAAAHAEDEDDPEAIRVKGEIEAFEADLGRKVDAEREMLLREWEDATDQDLARRATREILKRRADESFMREWARQQILFCVREPDDHHRRYFETIAEVDDLDDQIRAFLDRQCNAFLVERAEGKDSPGTPASSPSSESTAAEVPSEVSGPVAVNT